MAVALQGTPAAGGRCWSHSHSSRRRHELCQSKVGLGKGRTLLSGTSALPPHLNCTRMCACPHGRHQDACKQQKQCLCSIRTGSTLIAHMCQISAHSCRYVLRNWIAQNAITMAEKGDYSEVERVLRLLEQPFSDDAAQEGGTAVQSSERSLQYDGPVPQWAKRLCVSCSS